MFNQAVPTDRRQRRLAALLLAGVVLLLIGLGARLLHINTALRPGLMAIADRQQQGSRIIPARRGAILDVQGRVIAVSRSQPDVFVDPARTEDVRALADELATRVNLAPEEILDNINRRPGSRYVVIARRVDEVTADAIRAMPSPAVGLTDRVIRTYPLGESLGQVLGFVGQDGQGLEGVELAYDGHLSGKDGRRASIRDGRRRAMWKRAEPGCRSADPIDGGSVVLTIDAEIQRITEEAVAERIRLFEAKSGVGIVMSPKTGEVLAMACVPTFDPDRAAETPAEVRRNRAVTDPVEPGSTFKPFIACGALDGGFVTTDEKIDCHMGRYQVGRRTVTDVHPYGLLDIAGIIAHSSNIGMTIVGDRMGNEALHRTIRRFGFGEPTGIDFPGEAPGVVHPLRRWTSYSTVSVTFGYEVGVTPLQLASAMCSLVNDGIQLKPRLVRRLLAPDGEVVESFKPEVVRRTVPTQIARYMSQKLLVAVVEATGGRRAQVGPYRILGKTGTAKLSYSDRRGYEPDAYLSTFIGAAPVEDPELVALVMVRRPDARLGYYGSVVSARGVGEILSASLAYLGVPVREELALAAE